MTISCPPARRSALESPVLHTLTMSWPASEPAIHGLAGTVMDGRVAPCGLPGHDMGK
jgi:hypothetical protein